ncbi:VOC family protein [soil metagenome]
MPEPTDPTEAPFAALRLPTAPLAPRPEFADGLRRRLAAALDLPTRTTAQEAPAMSTTETLATAPAPSPLVPYLAVAGAAAALDWYRDVLGAIETTRFVGDDGRVGHAEITIGGARLMLADEYPEIDVVGPLARGGTSVTLHLEVADVDYTYERAAGAGATALRAPSDQGHGNRNAQITDPFGHRWMLSQPVSVERAAAAEVEKGVGGNGEDWTVTGRRPVEPGYLVMHTADLAKARTFFGALFDWEIEDGGAGGGHVANTRFPLGIAPPGDDSSERLATASSTTVYFRVDEIEPYAQRVVELGGRVLLRTDYASGGNAECTDDQGYRFDLWTPAPGY